MSNSSVDFTKVLFKTEKCKNGEQCKFKANCAFAHNKSELRTPEDNASTMHWVNYKSQICRYYQTDKCTFGKKCTFLHVTRQELDRRLPVFKDFAPILTV
jgi:hypothetical protein